MAIEAQLTDQSTPGEEIVARQRVRIVYEKGEAIKFISHQDEFRAWERTLRRADLPLLYKQGFNPQPHIQFASPLGVGFSGVAELLDITFSPPQPLDELSRRIAARLPPGVTLRSLEEVPVKTAALQSLLIGSDYTIRIYAAPGEISDRLLSTRIEQFLAEREVWRERQRKGETYTYNLRPLIFELRYDGYDVESEEHRIFLRVQQRSGATGRPDEVVDALGFDDYARTLRRDRIYLASRPEDVAIFAAYPVVEKGEIERASSKPKRRKRRRKRKSKPATEQQAGRSISERAGDEFG